MTDNITVSRELLRQVLRLMDKALDTDNVFGKLHNDAMDCLGALEAALEQAPVQEHEIMTNITVGKATIELALEAIELNWRTDEGDAVTPLLRAALAEPAPVQEQQPVAWASQTAIDIAAEGGEGIIVGAEADCLIPLYAVPQPAPAERTVQEPVCRGCGHPVNDLHMSTCPTKKWPMRVTPADAAPQAHQPVAEVAWDGVNLNTLFIRFLSAGIGLSVGTRLYTTPPAEPAVKLYDHGPQAETVAEALRDVSKWLNERPNRPLDLRHVAMLCAALAEPAPVQELDDEPSAQPHKLSEDEYTALAHRIASKYTHRSDPAFTAYTFLPHTLGQFVDAVQAAVWAKLGVEP